MNLSSKELRGALAGEYLLGNLSARARRRFEQLLARDAGLQLEVDLWHRRLTLLSLPDPVAAPAQIWPRVDEALDRADPDARLIRGTPQHRGAPRRSSARLWQTWSVLATAASLVLAVLVLQGPAPAPVTQSMPSLAASEPMVDASQNYPDLVRPANHASPGRYRGFMGHVSLPNESARWRVSVDLDTRILQVESIGSSALHADEDYQLWWISDEEIVSIGLLPRSGGWQVGLPRHVHLTDFSRLAVTREPALGSPAIDGPTGPVVMNASLRPSS